MKQNDGNNSKSIWSRKKIYVEFLCHFTFEIPNFQKLLYIKIEKLRKFVQECDRPNPTFIKSPVTNLKLLHTGLSFKTCQF